MPDFIKGRAHILAELRREIIGPCPSGEEVECYPNLMLRFPNTEDLYKSWHQAGTGEEIIQRDNPCKRYGAGVLYPFGTGILFDQSGVEEMNASREDEGDQPEVVGEEEAGGVVKEALNNKAEEILEEIIYRTDGRSGGETEGDEFDISVANSYLPSSMAVSFLADFPQGSHLTVEIPERAVLNINGGLESNDGEVKVNGCYLPLDVQAADLSRRWWVRKAISMHMVYNAEDICQEQNSSLASVETFSQGDVTLNLSVEVYARRVDAYSNKRLVTVSLVNRTDKAGKSIKPEACLFQAYFRVSVLAPDGSSGILPYPEAPVAKMDEEEKSLALLYRNAETFAVGHGCASDWKVAGDTHRVEWISAEFLPVYETPSITPDVVRADGIPLEVSMEELAGLRNPSNGIRSIELVADEYEAWVAARKQEISGLPEELCGAAEHNLKKCADCLERMKQGIARIKDAGNPKNIDFAEAFRLANHAMLLQQKHASREHRAYTWDAKEYRWTFKMPFEERRDAKGTWRAFQIAFILMNLNSTAENEDPFRDNVELIWFPTGGGKTEAYLGLVAFSCFLRRFRDPNDAGVNVIMRYTLRLLTSQQFQRACGLICAMEHLRGKNPRLGDREFSIGLWLGGGFTPNKRKDAVAALSQLNKDTKAPNPFVVRKCPWCNAQIGPSDRLPRTGYKKKVVKTGIPGYREEAKTVQLHCSDTSCQFSNRLPIYVVDEDIYEKQPDLVIGTVDKFALLSWKEEVRSIFGISDTGERACSPPALIIQDELHLISGPLGSMAGLYEALIEELCTNRRGEKAIKPKIVCSTATIRRYEDQTANLYGRTGVTLFPAPGIDAADSFFSRYAIDVETGQVLPGKIYVGVCGPGLGSVQTAQVRTCAALIQAPMGLAPEERDPWWTLLCFYNSLRELGGSISLMQSDIPDYLKAMWRRRGIQWKKQRVLESFCELTSRLGDHEIPEAIANLETEYGNGRSAIDCCLASNIIEVGVDIDRLSIMAVIGQPKSTSQYIQVTGRVGRQWKTRPGLVATIYAPGKPRDKSHFEKFRSYHQKLYAQVEPTSVTPFSAPVLKRALHAVMAGYVRQTGNKENIASPYPMPEQFLMRLKKIMEERIRYIPAADEEARADFEKMFNRRMTEWSGWERTLWHSYAGQGPDVPLLHPAGAYVCEEWKRYSWATMNSLRDVDAPCQAEISRAYLMGGDE